MKIAIYIDDDITPDFGGGYSYMECIIEGLIHYTGKNDIYYCLLFKKSKNILKSLNSIESVFLEMDKQKCGFFCQKLLNLIEKILPFCQKNFNPLKKETHVKKVIEKNAIDLIYYPHQHRCLTPDIPFVATNWDLAHITAFSFPELSGRHYLHRDHWYRNILPRALCVFAESEIGKKELIKYLNFPEHKIHVVPIFPGSVVKLDVKKEQQLQILHQHALYDKKFFFYPAQFWSIKNHYALIKAFRLIIKNYQGEVLLVLCGSDKGNQEYIKKVVNEWDMKQVVKFLGFISTEELYTLYKHALALVMPTFLGPTNMPILEAMALGCPVLCSDFEGHHEMADEAADFFNPANSIEIYESMNKIISDKVHRELLRRKGIEKYSQSKFNLEGSLKSIHESFHSLASIRSCWNTS